MEFEFVKEKVGKVKKLNEILSLIQNNKTLLAEFNLEVKVFEKGIELKSS